MARKKREAQEAEVPISSMIDIVFLLIIFFVVTASIDKEIDDEQVLLSKAPHGKPLKQKDPRSFVINVRKDGSVNVSMIPLTMEQVSRQLIAAAARWGYDIPIVIRGDKNTQHHYIKKVMKAVTDTQLYRVKFMAVIED